MRMYALLDDVHL